MRQFLFSSSMISAVATGLTLLRRSLRGPFTWQIALLWASWLISLVLAIAAIRERSRASNV
jgi:hypothetical protein